GRFRNWVLAQAVLVTLLQFLANLIGQLWDALAFLRPLTVFYYYQPQRIVLTGSWTVDPGEVWNGGAPLANVPVLAALFAVCGGRYAPGPWALTRRHLPAPL